MIKGLTRNTGKYLLWDWDNQIIRSILGTIRDLSVLVCIIGYHSTVLRDMEFRPNINNDCRHGLFVASRILITIR